jgi:hypothetical protein
MATTRISLHSILRWRELVQSAKKESNSQRLIRLIAAAEEAIFIRWQELPKDAQEREELASAAALLWELREKKFNVSGVESS